MKSEKSLNRRKILQGIFVGMGFLATKFSKAKAETMMTACGLTPQQTEGPFYPITDQLDKDADLIFSRGGEVLTQGKIIYVKGIVRDQNCHMVADALVEIWQACASGKYNHSEDTNPAPLDPHFQYWGQTKTNAQGEYLFRTIIPGAYPASTTWTRPPHIHFKILKRGYETLTTQMYFQGDSLNARDHILNELSLEEKKRVIVSLKTDRGRSIGQFDIVLKHL